MFVKNSFILCFYILLLTVQKSIAYDSVATKYLSIIDNNEDKYIFEGYYHFDNMQYNKARDSFLEAYKITKDRAYLKENIGILILMQKTSEAKDEAYKYLKIYPKDDEVRNVLIGILTATKQYEAAMIEARKLLRNNRSEQNLETISSVYFLKNDYKKSIVYLNEAYKINGSDQILDKIASTYAYFLNDKNKAITMYKEHIKNNGITPLIGEKLAMLFINSGMNNEAINIYLQLYDETENLNYIKVVLEIYLNTNRLEDAKKLLEGNSKLYFSDQKFLKILLEIYNLNKDYKNSIRVLNDLYELTNDPNFLALEAVFIYENSDNKNDIDTLNLVVSKLKKSLITLNDALYLNYLGYLMIEHELDIQDGIKYVKRALKIDGANPYYLDSLAWGYYKLKDCKSAKNTINKISQQDIEKEEEILQHSLVIKQCK